MNLLKKILSRWKKSIFIRNINSQSSPSIDPIKIELYMVIDRQTYVNIFNTSLLRPYLYIDTSSIYRKQSMIVINFS